MAIGKLTDCLDEKERKVFEYFKVRDHSLRSVETLPPAVREAYGIADITSHSTAKRRLDAVAKKLSAELRTRRLDGVTAVHLSADGTKVGDQTLMWVIALTDDGRRLPVAAEIAPT